MVRVRSEAENTPQTVKDGSNGVNRLHVRYAEAAPSIFVLGCRAKQDLPAPCSHAGRLATKMAQKLFLLRHDL
jgi:hypothetical protein